MKIKKGYKLYSIVSSNVVVPVGEASTKLNGVINLNNSGKLLWNRLEQGADENQLAEVLTSTYGITADKAKQDVKVFLDSLRSINCLEE